MKLTLQLFFVDLERVADDPHAVSRLDLDAETERRAARLLRERDRRRFLAGRAALRSLVAERPDELERSDLGKPLLPESTRALSWAHSGDRLLLGVIESDAPAARLAIGVDIEDAEIDRPFARLSRRFFSTEEHSALAALSAPARRRAFYELFTRKEALAKLDGAPLAPMLREPHFEQRDGGWHSTLAGVDLRGGWLEGRYAFASALRVEPTLGFPAEAAGEWTVQTASPASSAVLLQLGLTFETRLASRT